MTEEVCGDLSRPELGKGASLMSNGMFGESALYAQ